MSSDNQTPMHDFPSAQQKLIDDWLWCAKYKGTRKMDFEPSDDVFFDLYMLCNDNPMVAWDTLKMIWIKIKNSNQSIKEFYFLGPMWNLIFLDHGDVIEKILDYAKEDKQFLIGLFESMSPSCLIYEPLSKLM